ncbi:DinB family protein [Nostocoides sp. HKS02]|uniref:DinB family protein n=1 Tax=Nostocoides sp. HKS02 TaxID=1813880 RepID=UPI001E3B93E1|nr:DinB family protein [Tetrasphaera sp. HKS02]
MTDHEQAAHDQLTIVPDDKDWTWTLLRTCPDCGFEAARVPAKDLAAQILELTAAWETVLARATVRDRPAPGVWSPLEYGCHVRDVCRVFEGRVHLMLAEDGPAFPNWDQDETAVAQRYAEQDPAVVSAELTAAARDASAAFASVGEDDWQRRGLRSNGSEFSVLTLGQYFLHDLAHHLVDVGA